MKLFLSSAKELGFSFLAADVTVAKKTIGNVRIYRNSNNCVQMWSLSHFADMEHLDIAERHCNPILPTLPG